MSYVYFEGKMAFSRPIFLLSKSIHSKTYVIMKGKDVLSQPEDVFAGINSAAVPEKKGTNINYVPSMIPLRHEEQAGSSKSALAFGDIINQKGPVLNPADRSKIMDLMGGAFSGSSIEDRLHLHNPWPDSIYVPGKDKNAYQPFFNTVPDSNLYAREWISEQGSACKASAFEGTLHSYNAGNASSRNLITESGIGILYTPEDILSVISFEPDLECMTTHRIQVEFKSSLGSPAPDATPHLPVISNVQVKGSILTAAWEISPIPGILPELVPNSVKYHELFSGTFQGLGSMALQQTAKNFSGKSLASPILVQGGHTYLLGVVARVYINAVVTDDRGKPYPELDQLRFVLYGTVDCNAPQMGVFVQTVYQRGIHLSDLVKFRVADRIGK
jgi:hypothetical protein